MNQADKPPIFVNKNCITYNKTLGQHLCCFTDQIQGAIQLYELPCRSRGIRPLLLLPPKTLPRSEAPDACAWEQRNWTLGLIKTSFSWDDH